MLSSPQTIKKYVAKSFHVVSLFFYCEAAPHLHLSLEQDQITATGQADSKTPICYHDLQTDWKQNWPKCKAVSFKQWLQLN